MNEPVSDRNALLLQRWAAGVPTPAIAAEFAISPVRVKHLALRYGATRPPGYRQRRRPAIKSADLWAHVDRSGSDTDCWPWVGHLDENGYGQGLAHRRVFGLVSGAIPKGQMVLHRCDRRECCNPQHLYLGNAQDNIWDAIERGRFPTTQRQRPEYLRRDA